MSANQYQFVYADFALIGIGNNFDNNYTQTVLNTLFNVN